MASNKSGGSAFSVQNYINELKNKVAARNVGEGEFLQAVDEVLDTLAPCLENHPEFVKAKILDRAIEPERVIIFRVPWQDDKGDFQVNRGFRVQFNSAIGPYKGGIRFHPSVTLSSLKFLGFEQTFKNALTSLPMGGGKGGSDFDTKGKSEGEVMRFCQSFMNELFRHIGPNTDVPAGDIGVGAREVGFMFGQYRRLANEFTGVFTGKGLSWGGSLVRPEATGYGIVYFVQEILHAHDMDMKGKAVAISGFGQVAWGAVQKVNHLGGKVLTISGPDGFIYDKDGVSGEKIDYMVKLRSSGQDIVAPYAEKYKSAEFHAGKRPWGIKVDIAIPCAIQNELNGDDAKALVNNGVRVVCEGANMPSTPDAISVFFANKDKVLFAPGKAANAGGVATSGLEMTQNSMRLSWTREEVDAQLQKIMKNIHSSCQKAAEDHGQKDNYMMGANVAGFLKVADAMMAQGLI